MPTLVRPRLPYAPSWSREIEGYAYNAIRSYWPTLQAWYEWEDVMQEAAVVYLLCARRYTGVVDNPAWFMALFKTSWRRRLIGLVTSCPKYSLLEGLDYDVLQDAAPSALCELLDLIERLPVGLRLVLSDLCRPKGRLKVSPRTLASLRLALQA